MVHQGEPYPYRIDWSRWEQSVADETMIDEAPELLLSIDWDFFFPLPDLSLYPDQMAEEMAVSTQFNIEEWFSKQRSDAAWESIRTALIAVGQDPDQLMAPAHPTQIEAFIDLIQQRFEIKEVSVADSHAWGTYAVSRAAARAGKTVEILSFDAHHDCGYINYLGDDLERSRRRAWSRPSCDDWIQSSLAHQTADFALIVYPEWRRRPEWMMHPVTLPEHLSARAAQTSLDHYRNTPGTSEKRPVSLLLVRSSAYVPTFAGHDTAFLQLADRLAPAGFRCLDCDPPAGISIGDQDGCTPRL